MNNYYRRTKIYKTLVFHGVTTLAFSSTLRPCVDYSLSHFYTSKYKYIRVQVLDTVAIRGHFH